MNPVRFALLALALCPSTALAGMTLDESIAKPKVGFKANGEPGALDIDAKTEALTVADDGTLLTFTVDMNKVTTGIDLRDDHMRTKFLHTDKFPNTVIQFEKAKIAWPTETGKKATGKLEANFTAHGVTKPISMTYEVQKTKQGWKCTGSFDYNTNDHGIEVPNYLGVTVDAKQSAKAVLYLVDSP
jgi:polyisoprenoid-binding protein YceI